MLTFARCIEFMVFISSAVNNLVMKFLCKFSYSFLYFFSVTELKGRIKVSKN